MERAASADHLWMDGVRLPMCEAAYARLRCSVAIPPSRAKPPHPSSPLLLKRRSCLLNHSWLPCRAVRMVFSLIRDEGFLSGTPDNSGRLGGIIFP